MPESRRQVLALHSAVRLLLVRDERRPGAVQDGASLGEDDLRTQAILLALERVRRALHDLELRGLRRERNEDEQDDGAYAYEAAARNGALEAAFELVGIEIRLVARVEEYLVGRELMIAGCSDERPFPPE